MNWPVGGAYVIVEVSGEVRRDVPDVAEHWQTRRRLSSQSSIKEGDVSACPKNVIEREMMCRKRLTNACLIIFHADTLM